MSSNYALKWILQRITALFLIPLSFWFIYNCISFQNLDFFQLKSFFQSYLNSLLFLIMMFAMLVHAKLGCETIVEDYASSIVFKKISKMLINFITYISLFLVFLAIIKLHII